MARDIHSSPLPRRNKISHEDFSEHPPTLLRSRTRHTRICFRASTVLVSGHKMNAPPWLDRPPQVTGYDANTEEWLVEWLEGTTKEKSTQLKLPRLRVYLKAEDPFNFANRVADAHARRKVKQKNSTWFGCLVRKLVGWASRLLVGWRSKAPTNRITD